MGKKHGKRRPQTELWTDLKEDGESRDLAMDGSSVRHGNIYVSKRVSHDLIDTSHGMYMTSVSKCWLFQHFPFSIFSIFDIPT
jgi:hypothetical protein